MIRRLFCLFIILFAAVAVVYSGGSGEESGGGTLTILQGKPEIDSQLKAFAKEFEAVSGIAVVVKSCGGDSCSMDTQMRADFNAGEAPDIFQIDGIEGYKIWADYIDDLSDESWVPLTDLAFTVEGKIYGFPVAIEGWGMAYNKDLLDKAGINPANLTNYSAYKAAFEKIDSQKRTLGIDSVVSMSAGPGMHWVTAHHNFNSYLSNGLARDDLSIVNQGLKGKVDTARLREYAQWVKLLYDYSYKPILTTGDYDGQVGAFANQRAVFVHQGNWIEPNLKNANATFQRAFAPHGSSTQDTDGIFVSAPSWYVVNKKGNASAARQFLTFMAETDKGHDYMVNQILAIPAFKNVDIAPTAPLSASILDWSKKGKTYAWNQYYFTGEFRDQKLGPIYEQFAKGEISLDRFVDLVTTEFATLQ